MFHDANTASNQQQLPVTLGNQQQLPVTVYRVVRVKIDVSLDNDIIFSRQTLALPTIL